MYSAESELKQGWSALKLSETSIRESVSYRRMLKKDLKKCDCLQASTTHIIFCYRNSYRVWGRQATVPSIIGSRYVPRQASLPQDNDHDILASPLQIPSRHNHVNSAVGEIRPDLYKNLNKPEPEDLNGTLTFAMQYTPSESEFRVRVLKANNLPPKDVTGTSDPYVKVQLLPDTKTKHQTRVMKKCLNPVWNETFSFDVTGTDLKNRMLQLTVYDFDRFTRHDFMGRVLVPDLLEERDIYSEAILTKNLATVEGVS